MHYCLLNLTLLSFLGHLPFYDWYYYLFCLRFCCLITAFSYCIFYVIRYVPCFQLWERMTFITNFSTRLGSIFLLLSFLSPSDILLRSLLDFHILSSTSFNFFFIFCHLFSLFWISIISIDLSLVQLLL